MEEEKPSLIAQLNSWHITAENDDPAMLLTHKMVHALLIEIVSDLTDEVESLKAELLAMKVVGKE